ncbi:hypothetical protein QTP86_016102 [Hemibagrus guttatus]|nr:hypothetical protein QTP86_016102 [Hemibagrus guttatus]
MRKSGVAEKYVRVVQDMYERSTTVVRCAVGQTEEFKVELGLYQGSALSPFLFAIVMDQLSEELRPLSTSIAELYRLSDLYSGHGGPVPISGVVGHQGRTPWTECQPIAGHTHTLSFTHYYNLEMPI